MLNKKVHTMKFSVLIISLLVVSCISSPPVVQQEVSPELQVRIEHSRKVNAALQSLEEAEQEWVEPEAKVSQPETSKPVIIVEAADVESLYNPERGSSLEMRSPGVTEKRSNPVNESFRDIMGRQNSQDAYSIEVESLGPGSTEYDYQGNYNNNNSYNDNSNYNDNSYNDNTYNDTNYYNPSIDDPQPEYDNYSEPDYSNPEYNNSSYNNKVNNNSTYYTKTNPTIKPTPKPTIKPTATPKPTPVLNPTQPPVLNPTQPPTPKPTPKPTLQPTAVPTAAPSNNIWTDISSDNIVVGTEFTVGLRLNTDGKKLASYGMRVKYDPSALQLDISKGSSGITIGKDGFIAAVNANSPGIVSIAGFEASGKPANINLDLIKLNWKAIRKGSSVVTVIIQNITDDKYTPIMGGQEITRTVTIN